MLWNANFVANTFSLARISVGLNETEQGGRAEGWAYFILVSLVLVRLLVADSEWWPAGEADDGWLLTTVLKGRGSWGQGKHKCHSHFQEGQKGASQVASPKSRESDGADLPGWPVAWTTGVLWMLCTLTLARSLMQSVIVSLKPNRWHMYWVGGV